MNHRIGRAVFATVVGLTVAVWSYEWITDPSGREERAEQEQTVLKARELLADITQIQSIEIVDPLAPQRKVGKVYVYRSESGWEVSGYYRRGEGDLWHPYLRWMASDHTLTTVRVNDPGLPEEVVANPKLEVSP